MAPARTLTFPERVAYTAETNPNLLQAAWYISQATGNDNNNGLTSGTPLATFAELRRRLGYFVYVGIPALDIYVLDGTFDAADPVDFHFICNVNTQILFHGTPTVVYSGAFSAVTTIDRTTNTRPDVTDAGAVGIWADGQLLTDTTNTSYSWVTSADLGGGTVRTAAFQQQPTPFANPAVTQVDQSVSDNFELSTFPAFTQGVITMEGTAALTSASAMLGLENLTLGGSASVGRLVISSSSTTSFIFTRNCQIGALRLLGGAVYHKNAYFQTTHRVQGTVDVACFGGFTKSTSIHQHYFGVLEFDYDHLCEGLINTVDWGTGTLFIGTLGIFKTAADGIFVGNGRQCLNTVDVSTNVLLWGVITTSGYGVRVRPGGSFIYDIAKQPTLVGATNDALIGGTAKAWAAVPFIEPANNAMLIVNT